ncbi:alpha/beta hydrolase [Amycolatopsis sp. NBC_00345]|uniref:alpha/beta fold hydrolase n=1 Tax=Amycolatopsis sp. NBC_00345 TaxID=2975955 RepID=UPI002E268F28
MLLPYDEAGSGPAVVLLHARPADRSMWRDHLPRLAAAGYRAIALDLPGYGEAVLPDGHGAEPAQDVLSTLDQLGAGRFSLVGNSLGALVALQTAATAPERVEGLVLIGYRPHDQPATEGLDLAWHRERTALAARDLEGAVRVAVETWLGPKASPEIRTHAARMQRGNLLLRQAHGEPPRATDPDLAGLRPLASRTLVAVGEHDLPDFSTGGRALADAIGASGPVVAPSAAHLVPLEQPKWLCVLLQGFLTQPAGQTAA